VSDPDCDANSVAARGLHCGTIEVLQRVLAAGQKSRLNESAFWTNLGTLYAYARIVKVSMSSSRSQQMRNYAPCAGHR
jgi:hypothetical protein